MEKPTPPEDRLYEGTQSRQILLPIEGTTQPKPGIKTTEFWTTVGTSLAGTLAAFGFIPANHMSELANSITQIAGGVMAVVSVVAYIVSRFKVKKVN